MYVLAVLMFLWFDGGDFFVLDCAMVNHISRYLDDPATQDQISKGQVGFVYQVVSTFWSISVSELQIAVVKLVHEVCVCVCLVMCICVQARGKTLAVSLNHSSSYISDQVSYQFS